MRRALIAASATLLIGGGLTVVTAGTALAANCRENGCTTQDPYTEQCSATSSVTNGTQAEDGAVATVTNYYSYACDANWLVASENSTAVADGWSLRLNIYSYLYESASQNLGKQQACYPGKTGKSSGGDGSLVETCDGSTYNGSTGWPTWTDMVDGQYYTWGQMFINIGGTEYEFDADQ
jgi:hypothetical protein